MAPNAIQVGGTLLYALYSLRFNADGSFQKNIETIVATTDAGESWRLVAGEMPDSVTGIGNDRLQFCQVDIITAACRMDSGWVEIDMENLSVSKPSIPHDVIRYIRCSDSIIIAATNNDSGSYRLMRSIDDGRSWTVIEQLTFQDTTKTYLQGDQFFRVVHFQRLQDGSITMILRDAAIAGTMDCGETWHYRGRIRSTSMDRVEPDNMLDRGYETLLPSAHDGYTSDYGVLGEFPDRVAYRAHPNWPGIPGYGAMADVDSILVSARRTMIYRYHKADSLWTAVPWPEGLLSLEPYHSYFFSHAAVTSVFPHPDGSLTCYMPFHHNVFHWKPNEEYRRWTLPLGHGSIWERNDLLESGHSYTFRGPDTLLHRNSQTFVVDGTTHTPATPVPSDFSKKTTFFDILTDGEWWVFCDSSYRSTDEGATWHAGGMGLPRRSDGMISNISTLIRLSDSTILCGMRGIRRLSGDTDPDTIRVQAGGIWRSDDNGATWTPSDVGLGKDDYVFQIQSLGKGILLASSSLIFRDPELDNEFSKHRPQAYSAIVRSTNNGHTWEQVYVERRNRPASECQRTFVNAGNGRVFAATVEHGVLESRDFGRTWAPVADGLEDRVIYDLAVDTDGGLWAGTDKGIHYVMPSVPVSVAEHNGQHRDPEIAVPADRLRYTSVWSYPNPSRDHLTVRVNNADLTGSGLLTLTLHDMLGTTIDDLTERLLPNRSQRRVEFTYPTSHLPTGVYFLVLETSAGKEMSKVFVLR